MSKSGKIALFDLDGCLSDDRWRHNRLPIQSDGGDADYDAYHKDQGLDNPINASVLRMHVDCNDRIVFLTARPIKWASQTHSWLVHHFQLQHDDFELCMRPEGNTKPSPELKVWMFDRFIGASHWDDVVAAYDDREDVLDAYAAKGVKACVRLTVEGETPRSKHVLEDMTFIEVGTGARLRAMAETFEERNAVYGDNYKMVGKIMAVMFPEGAPPNLLHSDQFHLFELKIVKLTRFAISGLQHIDSIHDDAVYSAMIEDILQKGKS